MSDADKPQGQTDRVSRLGELFAPAPQPSEPVPHRAERTELGDILADKAALASRFKPKTRDVKPVDVTDEVLEKMIVGLARLAGAKDTAAVVNDFKRNRPLAKVVAKLLNAYRLETRGRKKTNHLEEDFILIERLRSEGFKGDSLYKEAVRISGRDVDMDTMKRYYRRARADRKRREIGRLLIKRN